MDLEKFMWRDLPKMILALRGDWEATIGSPARTVAFENGQWTKVPAATATFSRNTTYRLQPVVVERLGCQMARQANGLTERVENYYPQC
jgi:hypothetical protein